jgi:hypothetical protein
LEFYDAADQQRDKGLAVIRPAMRWNGFGPSFPVKGAGQAEYCILTLVLRNQRPARFLVTLGTSPPGRDGRMAIFAGPLRLYGAALSRERKPI